MKEIYLSIDIETLGAVAGIHPMMSLGAVAVDAEGKNYGDFHQNLDAVEGLVNDPETMQWWKEQSIASISALFKPEPRSANDVMTDFWCFTAKLKDQCDDLIFAAAPAAFDIPFVAYYAQRFLGLKLVKRTFCIKSAAQALLGFPAKTHLRDGVPAEWLRNVGGTLHNALDDARQQAAILVSVLQYWRDKSARSNVLLPKT